MSILLTRKKSAAVNSGNVKLNMRVKRGRDWEWGSQDCAAGKECVGTVISYYTIEGKRDSLPDIKFPEPIGWVYVRWDSTNKTNCYRIGARSCYDLVTSV